MIAGKSWIRNWINEHPAVWEFILFNVLIQCGNYCEFYSNVESAPVSCLYL